MQQIWDTHLFEQGVAEPEPKRWVSKVFCTGSSGSTRPKVNPPPHSDHKVETQKPHHGAFAIGAASVCGSLNRSAL